MIKYERKKYNNSKKCDYAIYCWQAQNSWQTRFRNMTEIYSLENKVFLKKSCRRWALLMKHNLIFGPALEFFFSVCTYWIKKTKDFSVKSSWEVHRIILFQKDIVCQGIIEIAHSRTYLQWLCWIIMGMWPWGFIQEFP